LNSAKVSSAIRQPLLAVILAAWTGAAAGAPWTVEGRVVGVRDGDTITVLGPGNAQHVVRLGGIDAPERKQAFGTAAKEALSSLVFDRRVEARCWKRDRYGRDVCAVFVGTRDVGLTMIRDGYAWHYKAFEREQSADDRSTYARSRRRRPVGSTGPMARAERDTAVGFPQGKGDAMIGWAAGGVVAAFESAFHSLTATAREARGRPPPQRTPFPTN
jgi:endonuclease YncB( thermonuclease family)